MRARSMQGRARKITIIVVVHLRSQQGVNATSRSDGVPNVADEEPGVCFGKIRSTWEHGQPKPEARGRE